jgi:hypothetical protein
MAKYLSSARARRLSIEKNERMPAGECSADNSDHRADVQKFTNSCGPWGAAEAPRLAQKIALKRI